MTGSNKIKCEELFDNQYTLFSHDDWKVQLDNNDDDDEQIVSVSIFCEILDVSEWYEDQKGYAFVLSVVPTRCHENFSEEEEIDDVKEQSNVSLAFDAVLYCGGLICEDEFVSLDKSNKNLLKNARTFEAHNGQTAYVFDSEDKALEAAKSLIDSYADTFMRVRIGFFLDKLRNPYTETDGWDRLKMLVNGSKS